MKYLLSFISLVVLVACHSHSNLQHLKPRQDAPCPCDSNSQCPAGRLDAGSLCACQNNAAMFCWYRNNRACASPTLQQCPGAPQTTAAATATSTKPKYTPPYGQGNGGLNCVEIGYCSRASRSKTATTITVNGTPTVISVAVGLPTGETVPDPFAPPLEGFGGGLTFTSLPGAGPVDSTPSETPGPRVRVRDGVVEELRREEGRFEGM